jgi:bifunctional oligoribonuclease and PAP phosphatase NrnA
MQDTPILPVSEDLLSFIRENESFIVAGHLEPDADCIGSQLALGSALRRLGKTVHLVSPGPFDRQEINQWEGRFIQTPESLPPENIPLIVVDCSSPDRIVPFDSHLAGRSTAVIDHHRTGVSFGDVRFIEPEVPANTILVLAIVETLVGSITEEEAYFLFLGLATDTGFFHYLEEYQPIAFDAAARLSRAGASPRSVAALLGSGRSWGSRKIISRMLDRAEPVDNDAVIITHMTLQDELDFGTRRDTDTLYRLLLSIEGVRVIAVVKEKREGCTVSFRATDDTDVSVIAATLGGGGHQKAAGAFLAEPLAVAMRRVREKISGI